MSAPPALAPGLARKVKKVLSIKSDSPDLIEALGTLSDVYDSNTVSNRRRLRAIIEGNSVSINLEFLDSTKTVVKELASVQEKLENLSKSCNTISTTLSGSKASTAQLLDRTDALTRELQASERKSVIISTFLDQYQLSPEEMSVLQADAVDEAFFSALKRVHLIHGNCRSLLRTHHQRAGLEMMDAMASYQEAAYERLCRWVQAQCHSLTDLDVPEINPLLQQAAAALRQRPVLFRYCAEEVATARHNAVFQNFVTALTQGGPGGMPRPIEMHAHDPRRYLGDMFAWVHQALASEQELLVSLFGDNLPTAPGLPGEVESADRDMPAVSSLLDKVFEGICRPLKARVDQLLLSNPSALLCFQIHQLLSFYAVTLEQLVKASTSLTRTILMVRDRAVSGFQEQLKGKTNKLLRSPPPPARDLSCPAAINDLMKQILEVAESYEGSMNAGLPGEKASQSFDALLQAVLEPLVEVCEKSADMLESGMQFAADDRLPNLTNKPTARNTLKSPMQPVIVPNANKLFLVNCLASMHTPLSMHRSCVLRAQGLQDQIDEQVGKLVTVESSRISQQAGLATISARIRGYTIDTDNQTGASMTSDPALQLQTIADAMRAMFVAVSAPDAIPEYEQLAVPRLRVGVSRQVAAALAAEYREVYAAVEDPVNGYAEAGGVGLIKNTPKQTSTVLGVEEV